MKKEIIIIGGGTAGASAFAYFSFLYKHIANVKMVTSKEIPTVGVGEASVGHIKTFLSFMDIDPDRFLLTECGGNIKYGVHLKDWYKNDWPYFTPVGRCGYDVSDYFNYSISYKDMWTSWSALDLAFNNASPFVDKKYESNKTLPKSLQDYAYQFDAGLFAEKITKKGVEFGGKIVYDNIVKLVPKENSKEIDYGITESGEKITGDFWVDCSGFHKLIKNALNLKEKSYPDMNNNRAWATRIPYISRKDEFPYLSTVECEAMNAGWRWQIGLKERIGTGYVFSTDYISEDEALQEFKNSFDPNRINEKDCHLIKFETTRLEEQCGKNWLSVGLSASFVEPLESTSIFLMHINLIAFSNIHQLTYMPEKIELLDAGREIPHQDFFDEWFDITEEKINSFNNYVNYFFDNTVDYIAAHYAVNKNQKSQYWIDWEKKRKKYLKIIDKGLTLKDNSFFLRPAWSLLAVGNQITPDETPMIGIGRLIEKYSENADFDEIKQVSEEITNEELAALDRKYLGYVHDISLTTRKISKYTYPLNNMYEAFET